MKFFISQIAIGSPVAVRNSTVAGMESSRSSWTNRPYTGTRIAVMGSPVANSRTSRIGRPNLRA